MQGGGDAMAGAWYYLERLCRFPHRGTGTHLEAAAASEVESLLTELGYKPELQRFRAPRDTLYLGPALVMSCFVVAAFFGWRYPWLGLLLCVVSLVPMVGEMLGARIDFDLLLPMAPSQNVIARLPAAGMRRRTLVVSAHYDTQRASLLFHPRFIPCTQAYFYLAYAGLLVIPAALAGRWLTMGAAWTSILLAVGAGLSAANALFLLFCRMTGRYGNGANDNASGASLLLSLAARYQGRPLPDTQLVFLFTGAEEVGTRGMKRFLRDCGLHRAGTYFINLDNLGAGALHYLTGEGMLVRKPYSPELISLARAMASEHGLKPRSNLLLPTDALPPALAGYQAISFLAFWPDGSLPHYHWHTDRPEQIDREALARGERFIHAYIGSLTSGAEESARGRVT